ncbi:MAG: hypothetical protein ACYDIC_16720 [Desulfobaccales bacterium]
MSSPTSSATVEFQFSMIDAEIRKILEQEGVRFKPRVFGPIMELDDVSGENLELDDPLYDLEVEVEEGIFRLHNREARDGEFYDLEHVLVKKSIPFDRDTSPDWAISAELRIYRPGNPALDLRIPQEEEILTLVHKLRGKLSAIEERAFSEVPGLQEIVNCLDEVDPAFPPLADWMKRAAKDKEAA